MGNGDVSALVERLRDSRKYRTICDATLERIARWAAARYPKPKIALKMAKNKLHQAYGAYLDSLDPTRVEEALTTAKSDDAIRHVCRNVLESHASTRERMAYLDTLYAEIFTITGTITSIRDLACGLHPFALPWMGLASDTRYIPADIDTRLCALHNALLRALELPELAYCDDLLCDRTRETVDLTFLFKTLPCLDRQKPGASERILPHLNTRWLAVSFPTRSLGGRNKGMDTHYAAIYEPKLEAIGHIVGTVCLPNERVYLIGPRER